MEIKKIPAHLVVIPDGNRRWARQRGKPPWEGHRVGMVKFREVKDMVFQVGIPFFTFWGASYDNLSKRTKAEVRFLMMLFRQELARELREKTFVKDEARIRIVGEWHQIIKDARLKAMADQLEDESRHFAKRHFTLLLGYDGKREMIKAISKIKNQKSKNEIDYDFVRQALWTAELPPVDLVIRTGGEPHWSAGFMMWHTTDSQFYFTDTFWPSFEKKDLMKAIHEYERRERRFGK